MEAVPKNIRVLTILVPIFLNSMAETGVRVGEIPKIAQRRKS